MFIHAGSHPKNVKPTYTNISTPNITLVPKLNLINVKVVKNKINIDKVTFPKSLLNPMFVNKLSKKVSLSKFLENSGILI